MVWVGGVATAILIGVLTGLVQDLVNPSPTVAGPPVEGQTPSAAASSGSVEPRIPLSATVRVNRDNELTQCRTLVIDKTPDELPPVPELGAGEEWSGPLQAWASKVGAVDGQTTNVEVTLQGQSGAAVVLHALHVKIVERRSPLKAKTYQVGECGGPVSPRYFAVNLDARAPVAEPKSGATNFPYQISEAEPEVFLVSAETDHCDCSWYLELDWSSQGDAGTLKISNHGKPFRTTGVDLRDYLLGDGSWFPTG